MVLFNHSTRELTAKIVYYGPGLCGKTTNLRVLHERLEKGTAGRLLSLATAQDRTIYFDLLPVELGNIKGYTVRFQLCTVPGQVFYNETRKLVLRGVDGLVFVVDSQWSMLSHDLESFQNLKENLREADISLESLPLVIQYNKRDLPGVLSIDALQEALGFQAYPFVEGVAASGGGVVETFKLISKLTFVDLLRRLQRGPSVERDLFGSPEVAAQALADPAESTSVRAGGGPPERRSSFSAASVAVESAPSETPAESPFDASTSWLSPPPEEAISDSLGASAAIEPDPFADSAPAAARASASDPDTLPGSQTVQSQTQPAEVEAFALPPIDGAREGVDLEPPPPSEASAQDSALAENPDAEEAPVAPSEPAPTEPLAAAPDDSTTTPPFLSSSNPSGMQGLQSQIEDALAILRSDLHALGERLDAADRALRDENARDRDILSGSMRVVESAQGALSQRMASLEGEIGRIATSSEQAHRHTATRLEAVDQRTKNLAESIRRALDTLND